MVTLSLNKILFWHFIHVNQVDVIWCHFNLKENSLTNVLYHVPHQSQVNTLNSGLLLCMSSKLLRKSTYFFYQYMSPLAMLPSVLFYKEGLYIFMQHSSKNWRGSPFTGSPHHHLVRVEIITIYFSSHSFHPTLISTSLFYSICHTAIWALIALPPWSFHSRHLIGPRTSRATTASTLYQWELVLMTPQLWRFQYLNEEAHYWHKQFQDLIELKGLDAAAKLTNANILTSGAGREKWQQAHAKVLGNPPKSPR